MPARCSWPGVALVLCASEVTARRIPWEGIPRSGSRTLHHSQQLHGGGTPHRCGQNRQTGGARRKHNDWPWFKTLPLLCTPGRNPGRGRSGCFFPERRRDAMPERRAQKSRSNQLHLFCSAQTRGPDNYRQLVLECAVWTAACVAVFERLLHLGQHEGNDSSAAPCDRHALDWHLDALSRFSFDTVFEHAIQCSSCASAVS